MLLSDPAKMDTAKASFRRQMRWARYIACLLAIYAAYHIGLATGQVERINTACAAWIAAGNNFQRSR